MKHFRPSDARGNADHGWLKSKHSFSFADYYDPNHMGFGPLRVINEDRVAPGRGFGAHPHRDMEIISYVVDGALEHRDSMGQVAEINPGEVQRMSAGTGVVHSEYNASKTDPVHFLQIWIMPDQQGLKPSYAQQHYDDLDGSLRLVASNDGRDGSISIHADVNLYASKLRSDARVELPLKKKRGVWVQVIKGLVTVNDQPLESGDGLALADVNKVAISAMDNSEFLLFDMAL
jgi:redox-sensitive bicupin YhaK (pirin superfamily)